MKKNSTISSSKNIGDAEFVGKDVENELLDVCIKDSHAEQYRFNDQFDACDDSRSGGRV